MISDPAAGSLGEWKLPECPFSVHYSRKAFDEIRLAVMDAYFSLPRGGAEVGGILLGRHEAGRVFIHGHVALECEHASGPSFTLSDRDHARLAELFARGIPDGAEAVGWYHSHTRSEIFLSEADLAIHKQYFREPWQIAVVLKPHTFLPTRAGFFFREANGKMRADAAYQEVTIAPFDGAAAEGVEAEAAEVAVEPAEKPLEPAAALESTGPKRLAGDTPAPSFLQVAPERPRRWLWVVLAVASGGALGAGYQARHTWVNANRPRPQSAVEAAPISLRLFDNGGQLSITWDRGAPAVLNAAHGTLTIRDGEAARVIELDGPHLRSGSFTYTRQGERVDVTLELSASTGERRSELITFLGKLPEPVPPPSDEALREQIRYLTDELRAERARSKWLGSELAKERQAKQTEKPGPDQ